MSVESRSHERRRSVRLRVNRPGSYTRFDEEGRPIEQRPVRSLNISAEGVGLESRYPVDPGEILRFTMALRDNSIRFRGKVIYVNRTEGEGIRFGVSIRDMSKTDRIALIRFIYYFDSPKTA
ncbi:MAG: PilZ domain-containing protein [Deltaproteobacteria bacterium]|nr:PilZ domain-containing protein [Deltaproteobacteria bacterium]MBW2122724.1 PilZ domain-containing protein [Deltaproteobacteria bacterium]